MTPRFVLASASPARLGLFRSLGIEPEVIVSGVPEDDVTGTPPEVVLELARRKAAAVAASLPADVVVLGCDSLLDVDGEAFGKPGTADAATARWRALRGRRGVLRTGHCVLFGGREETDVASTVVRFARPSDTEIARYVATGEPLHVAGGFTLDGRSAAFIEGIDGCPSNVIGCSLPLVRTLLDRLGLSLTDWWP